MYFNWRNWFNPILRPFQGRTRTSPRVARKRSKLLARPGLERLEDRLAPAIGTLEFVSATSSFVEGDILQIAIRLTTDAPLDNDVSVDIDPGTGSAINGTDFNMFSGAALTFLTTDPPTIVSGVGFVYDQLLNLGTKDDLRVESNETIEFLLANLNFSAPDSISLGTQTTTVTLTDNDSATVAINSAVVYVLTEGATSEFVPVTLTLNTSGDVGTAGLDVTVKANLPVTADFTAIDATFSPGDFTSVSANITVTAIDDRRVERTSEAIDDQLLSVTDNGGLGANVTVAGTSQPVDIVVNDNDSASVSIANGTNSVTEGSATSTAPVTLTLSTTGTGTEGLDVTVKANLTGNADYSGNEALFSPGDFSSSSASIEVIAIDDRRLEEAESFADQFATVTDSGGANVAVSASSGTRTIDVADNETATIAFEADKSSSEGTPSPSVLVNLTIVASGNGTTGLDTTVSIDVGNSGAGTATPGGVDFTFSPQTVTFTPGNFTGSGIGASLTLINDQLVESNETIDLAFTSGPSTDLGGRITVTDSDHTLTIADNDSAMVSVSDGTTSVAEGSGSANVTATLTLFTSGTGPQQLASDIVVNLAGNADYTSTGVTFSAGALSGNTLDIVVSAVDDQRVERTTETFFDQSLLGVSSVNGATAGSPNIAVADNDSATVYTPGITAAVAEGGPDNAVQLVLTLQTSGAGTPGLDVTVSIDLPGNADYSTTAATFSPGDFSSKGALIFFLAVNDQRLEGTESFAGQLLSVTDDGGADVSVDPSAGATTIEVTDNESATILFEEAVNALDENTVAETRTVILNLAADGFGTIGLDQAITVRVSVDGASTAINGTAVGSDFTFTDPTDLLFAAADGSTFAQNVSIAFFEDFTAEGNEAAILGLSILNDGTNGQASIPNLALKSNTTTIVDDDTAADRRFDLPVAGTYTLTTSGASYQLFQGAALIASEPAGAFHILINGTAGPDEIIVEVRSTSLYNLTLDGQGDENFLRIRDLTGGAALVDSPTSATSGTIQVSYNGGSTSTIAYQNLYAPVLIATASPLPAWTINHPGYSQTVLTTGGKGAKTFTLTGGALPPGLILSPTGVISGKPTLAGTFTFTLKAADTVGDFAVKTFSLTINKAIVFVPATLPTYTVGALYSKFITTTGGTGAKTLSVVGSLPPGLTFNAATGKLSGTIKVTSPVGGFTITIRAVDAVGAITTKIYKLTGVLSVYRRGL
jgi:hypothetical protein